MNPSAASVARLLVSGLALHLVAGVLSATSMPPLADPMDTNLSGNQRLEALIERVKHEQSQMQTMEARFVQRRESDLLVKPEESRGIFSYSAPDQVRWEYLSPNPITVLIDGREMVTWYRDLDRADHLKISRYSEQVFKYLGASGAMETLVDYFRVSVNFPDGDGEPYRLRLLPKYDRIRNKLKSMTIWIDATRFVPTRLIYVGANGDSTEYRFDDFRVNGEIPEERFVLDLPERVKTRVMDLGKNSD